MAKSKYRRARPKSRAPRLSGPLYFRYRNIVHAWESERQSTACDMYSARSNLPSQARVTPNGPRHGETICRRCGEAQSVRSKSG